VEFLDGKLSRRFQELQGSLALSRAEYMKMYPRQQSPAFQSTLIFSLSSSPSDEQRQPFLACAFLTTYVARSLWGRQGRIWLLKDHPRIRVAHSGLALGTML